MRVYRVALLMGLLLLSGAEARETTPAELLADTPIIDPNHPPALSVFTITSHGQRMNAIAYLANGPGPHPTVLLLHGIPGNEKNLDLAQALRAAGWNVVFFHYRGAWGSEGEFSLAHVIEDTQAAVDHLQNPENAKGLRIDRERLALVGHSMGGFAAINASDHAGVACTATIAPWNAVEELADPRAAERFRQWMPGASQLNVPDLEALLAELSGHRDQWHLPRVAASIDHPLLVLTGLLDDIHADPYRRIENISIVEIPQADHSFSARRASLIRQVLGWLNSRCR